MDTLELVSASHHEVGHALLSYHVGFLFEFIELQVKGAEFHGGRVLYDFKGVESNTENGLLRIQCALGGPIAQTIFEKGILDLYRPEFARDRSIINGILTGANLKQWKDVVDKQSTIVQAFLEEPQSMEARKFIAQQLFQSHKISYVRFTELAKIYKVRRLNQKADVAVFHKILASISRTFKEINVFIRRLFNTKL